jgi:formylglycine-generating enzyme required for sulfatase activity
MKQILLMIVVVALVGCETTKPTPPKAFTNTLGMKFVPVKGTDVQFSIWETRVKDYAAYAAADAAEYAYWKNPGFTQADTHPVVEVRWEDAQAFCEWLTKKEMAEGKIKAGQKYRLPTDAEWSVAVGLGIETGNSPKEKNEGVRDVYPWGKELPPLKGAGNYGESLNVDSYEYTSPVGSFGANAHGIHDLGGNVLELCEDWYDPDYEKKRVVRGGSWRSGYAVRSSRRSGYSPVVSFNYIGFRCVLVGGSGE